MDHNHDHDMTTMPAGSTTPLPSGVCIPKMDMSLHWGVCEWILTRSWKADTPGKFWFATIMIFLATIAYEGLKYYRELLYFKTQQAKFVKKSDGSVVKRDDNLTIKKQLLNIPHGVQTVLHGIQIFISYLLMLIVMLANMYIIIAICLGAAIGYFLFSWMRRTNADLNECCY